MLFQQSVQLVDTILMNLKYLESPLHVLRHSGTSGALKKLIYFESLLSKWLEIDNCSNIEGIPQTWPPIVHLKEIVLLSMMIVILQFLSNCV